MQGVSSEDLSKIEFQCSMMQHESYQILYGYNYYGTPGQRLNELGWPPAPAGHEHEARRSAATVAVHRPAAAKAGY